MRIYTTARQYIEDVTIATSIDGADGMAEITVKSTSTGETRIEILDAEDQIVATHTGTKGSLRIRNAYFWFPKPGTPYLYTARITSGEDIYDLKFGIRTVTVEKDAFLINDKKFYFKGTGMHEDSVFRGRGIDQCLEVKDEFARIGFMPIP